MTSSSPFTTALPTTLIVVAWLVAGSSWWLCRQRAFGRARTLGHLAWVTAAVALLVPMAAERIASLFPPGGLPGPQAGLMAALPEGIVSGPPVVEVIHAVLFVAVAASAAVVGIVVVVRCRERTRGNSPTHGS